MCDSKVRSDSNNPPARFPPLTRVLITTAETPPRTWNPKQAWTLSFVWKSASHAASLLVLAYSNSLLAYVLGLEKAQHSLECRSLSYRQMLDASADLIHWDIRDTSCPFGSPRWHISGSSCTPALFNPAVFIPRSLWLMWPVLGAHRSLTTQPDAVYSYLCFYHVSDVNIWSNTWTRFSSRGGGVKHISGVSQHWWNWQNGFSVCKFHIFLCVLELGWNYSLFLPHIHALATPIIVFFCW